MLLKAYKQWGIDSVKRFRGIFALALWVINFYLLLAWLQPALIPGRHHIVTEIPWWVAAATHLVFGWTMLLVQPLGKFVIAGRAVPEAS